MSAPRRRSPSPPASRCTRSTTSWRTSASACSRPGDGSAARRSRIGTQNALPANLGALLVSGGHTEILRIRSITDDVELLGSTIDDAAGEAYDKVARLLGLGYPGGPAIDKLARTGNAKAIRFPRGLSQPKYMGTAEEPGPHRYDWSFSGLKTAVARCVEQFEARGETVPVADIAAAFQEAVVDVITAKAVLACRENGITELLLGGGVAANSRLRQLTEQRCSAAGIRLTVPPLRCARTTAPWSRPSARSW